MKKMALFLALVFGIFAVQTTAYALPTGTPAPETESEWEQKLFYEGDYIFSILEDGTAEIYGYRGKGTATVTVPTELRGYRVASIGKHAFSSSDVTEIVIPDSVTSIEGNPFASYGKLLHITFSPEHPVLEYRDGVLFDKAEHRLSLYPVWSTAESYTVPDGTRIIEESAFRGAVHLKEIILPDSLTAIGYRAFSGCESLLVITVPDGVTDIGKMAFLGCENMTSLVLGNSVSFIGPNAFTFCSSLTEIILPDSITYVGETAFGGCSSVRSIRLPYNNAFIERNAFAGCYALREVTIPDGLLYFEGNPFPNCPVLTDIRISPDHPTIELIDGVLFDRLEKRLIFCPPSLGLETYTVPEGTLSIAPYAFRGCESLTQVTIPGSLTSIGDSAFAECLSLREVIISDGISSIESMAFFGCTALEDVIIPASVASVGYGAFAYCDSVLLIIEPDSCMEEYAQRADIPYRYASED